MSTNTDFNCSLPFLLDNDCTLGIAVKSYLDELLASETPSSPDVKQLARTKGMREWLPYSIDFSADIDTAFLLWDAVSFFQLTYIVRNHFFHVLVIVRNCTALTTNFDALYIMRFS